MIISTYLYYFPREQNSLFLLRDNPRHIGIQLGGDAMYCIRGYNPRVHATNSDLHVDMLLHVLL